MTAVAKFTKWISPEEYLAGERGAEVRHEYLDGEVFAMAGESKRHNTIAKNVTRWLDAALRGKPCQVYQEGVKIRIRTANETAFYYPDVFVGCDPRDVDEYFSDYPSAVFEVLSPSTARYDEREKRWSYQTIETLQTYVMVDQLQQRVVVWQRIGPGEHDFAQTILAGADDSVALPGFALRLPLAEIYAGVVV